MAYFEYDYHPNYSFHEENSCQEFPAISNSNIFVSDYNKDLGTTNGSYYKAYEEVDGGLIGGEDLGGDWRGQDWGEEGGSEENEPVQQDQYWPQENGNGVAYAPY